MESKSKFIYDKIHGHTMSLNTNSNNNSDSHKNHYTAEWFDWQSHGSHISAKQIVPHIKELYNPNFVVDIGGGIGAWCKVFEENDIESISIDGD